MPTTIFGQRRRILLAIMAYILFATFGIGWTLATFIEERDQAMMKNISLFLMRGVQEQAYELASQFQYKLLGMQILAQEIVRDAGQTLDEDTLRRCGGRIPADNLFLANEHGHVWSLSAVPADLLEKDYYRNVLAGQPAISPLLNDVDGAGMVVFAIPLMQGTRFCGTLGAIYRSDNFTNFFPLTSVLSSDGVILLNTDGRLVGAAPSGRETSDYFRDIYRQQAAVMDQDVGADAWVLPVEDRQGRTVHLCVSSLPLNDWRLATVITGKELALDFNDRAQVLRNLFVRLCVLFVLTMFFVVLCVRALFARRMDVLEREASTDPLTGLLNRNSFERRVEACLAERQEGLLAVFDLDNFKQINDQHGHPAGDAVIRRVGELMSNVLPESSLFGRLGGDEFLLFLPHVATAEAGTPSLDVFMDSIRGDSLLHRYGVTASMGLSIAPHDGRTFHRLYRCADVALYASKRFGRNRISSYAQVQATPLPGIDEA